MGGLASLLPDLFLSCRHLVHRHADGDARLESSRYWLADSGSRYVLRRLGGLSSRSAMALAPYLLDLRRVPGWRIDGPDGFQLGAGPCAEAALLRSAGAVPILRHRDCVVLCIAILLRLEIVAAADRPECLRHPPGKCILSDCTASYLPIARAFFVVQSVDTDRRTAGFLSGAIAAKDEPRHVRMSHRSFWRRPGLRSIPTWHFRCC